MEPILARFASDHVLPEQESGLHAIHDVTNRGRIDKAKVIKADNVWARDTRCTRANRETTDES